MGRLLDSTQPLDSMSGLRRLDGNRAAPFARLLALRPEHRVCPRPRRQKSIRNRPFATRFPRTRSYRVGRPDISIRHQQLKRKQSSAMGHRSLKLTPEFEHDLARDPRLGYEELSSDFVRCVEHGSPAPLERWHCHDEYELQLIVGARGRAFVGDYVGHFEPGHLVLTGPRLPHNWISTDLPPDGIEVRSLVIQFREAPLREGMRAVPELQEVRPLLEQARAEGSNSLA